MLTSSIMALPGRNQNRPALEAGSAVSVDRDEHLSALDLDLVGLQVDADRRALGPAGAIVEASVVLRTFDDVVEHQPVGEMGVFVGADALGGEILVAGRAIDGIFAPLMVEADHVLRLDLAGVAGLDPLLGTLCLCGHSSFFLVCSPVSALLSSPGLTRRSMFFRCARPRSPGQAP